MEKPDQIIPTIQRVRRVAGISTGFTSIEILRKIQEDLEVRQINPEQFEGRILFMSMFTTTLIGHRMEFHWTVFRIPKKREITQKYFSEHIGHSSVLEIKKNGLGRTLVNQKEMGQ